MISSSSSSRSACFERGLGAVVRTIPVESRNERGGQAKRQMVFVGEPRRGLQKVRWHLRFRQGVRRKSGASNMRTLLGEQRRRGACWGGLGHRAPAAGIEGGTKVALPRFGSSLRCFWAHGGRRTNEALLRLRFVLLRLPTTLGREREEWRKLDSTESIADAVDCAAGDAGGRRGRRVDLFRSLPPALLRSLALEAPVRGREATGQAVGADPLAVALGLLSHPFSLVLFLLFLPIHTRVQPKVR